MFWPVALDLGALQAGQQLGRRSQVLFGERQVAEGLLQRFEARQTDRSDTALVVVNDDAFQHVIDLVETDVQVKNRIAIDHRLVLVIGDAAT